jgi:nicotinamidase-related amidase
MNHSSDIRLLIVDPQNDFCDPPPERIPAGEAPALPVPGAHADMERLAAFLDRHGAAIDEIAITLDTHQRLDIAHPGFWRRGDGGPVAPFTEIHSGQVEAGEYRLADPAGHERAIDYLRQLEHQGRYTLMVWPEHCVAGTWGHQVHPAVQAASQRWSQAAGKPVQFITKGLNPWTEHYSALQAEVPDPSDPGTQFNQALSDWAACADTLLIAGEAGSHCVGATLEHLLDHWPAEQARHVVMLDDCISPVQGFEAAYQGILSRAQARGVSITDSRHASLPRQAGTR